MINRNRFAAAICALVLTLGVVFAQDEKTKEERRTSPNVVAAATDTGVRFTAPGTVVETRLEVFASSGEKVLDSGFRRGNVLDWSPAVGANGQSAPQEDEYLCVVTVRDLSGQLRQRLGVASLRSGKVRLKGTDARQLNAAQADALARGGGSEVAEISDEDESLTILGDGEAALTVVAHDGRDGQLTSTAGALTFRTGDLFAGRDKEQMRITPEGRVGIGTDKPEATLDVAGTVRASGGFRFSDGTRLNSMGGKLTFSDAAGDPIPAPAAGTGTINRVAKWTETGGAGNLGDSAIFESGGQVGIGTTAPEGVFHIQTPTTTVFKVVTTGSVPNGRAVFQMYRGTAATANGWDFGYNLDLAS
ncbi:MAG: hypothetical protein H7Z38_18705, partial [Rubrivivax sp.]|nr:hypothetical protein [Pyrinomonadaceae bacterium]